MHMWVHGSGTAAPQGCACSVHGAGWHHAAPVPIPGGTVAAASSALGSWGAGTCPGVPPFPSWGRRVAGTFPAAPSPAALSIAARAPGSFHGKGPTPGPPAGLGTVPTMGLDPSLGLGTPARGSWKRRGRVRARVCLRMCWGHAHRGCAGVGGSARWREIGGGGVVRVFAMRCACSGPWPRGCFGAMGGGTACAIRAGGRAPSWLWVRAAAARQGWA